VGEVRHRRAAGCTSEIGVALDWTDFQHDEHDDHTTLAAYVVTRHGRATPLAWKTVLKSDLKGKRVAIERDFLSRLARALPDDVHVTLLADRGFADQTLYQVLDILGWDYVVRFKDNVLVEHNKVRKRAREWVPRFGRAIMLKAPTITSKNTPVKSIVLVHAKRMKESWCLVTSLSARSAADVVKVYGKRFTIEETFRDQKDIRFGLGLRATHIRNPKRRDRLLLLTAIAQALLTLLGAASEATGLDRTLKVNTSTKRTHSLFRQGSYWYGAIPTMRDDWFHKLMSAFDRLLKEHQVFSDVFATI
jgi:hypothetical protein